MINSREPEKVIVVAEPASGLQGWLVIDSTVNGRTCGGIRMLPNVTLDEIQGLARSMTLKQGFTGIPRGGAKGGIVTPEGATEQQKAELLNRFAEKIEPLISSGQYIPGTDMGTSRDLIAQMFDGLGKGKSRHSNGGLHSGLFTSMAVQVSIHEALAARGRRLEDCRIAIEGFGSVGSALAQRLFDEGARVVAISNVTGALFDPAGLNIPELIELQETEGEHFIATYRNARQLATKEELLELDVEVLSPCGRSGQINERNMERIKAGIICAGANNPVTPAADRYFFAQGVLYYPDFASNCGGVVGNMLEFAGLSVEQVFAFLAEQLPPKLAEVIAISQATQQTPLEVGIQLAEANFQRMKNQQETSSAQFSVQSVGRRLYKSGFLPQFMVRQYARKSAAKMMQSAHRHASAEAPSRA